MSKEQFECRFWFWSDKLRGILTVLANLIHYELTEDEFEIIRQDLRLTNDELNQWTSHKFSGQELSIEFKLSFDSEEKSDMIHINIITSNKLADKIKTVDLFQSQFK